MRLLPGMKSALSLVISKKCERPQWVLCVSKRKWFLDINHQECKGTNALGPLPGTSGTWIAAGTAQSSEPVESPSELISRSKRESTSIYWILYHPSSGSGILYVWSHFINARVVMGLCPRTARHIQSRLGTHNDTGMALIVTAVTLSHANDTEKII